MPALITHHLFGEEAAHRLPEGILSSQEEALAFLLGNQGPDPLFARFTSLPARDAACNRLAHLMHDVHSRASLLAFREAVGHLPEQDAAIGRAFALGQLGHYLLDSRAHAFVFGQEYAICAADADLEDAGSEVHGVIESDIDVWMLWNLRQQTVLDAPAAQCLARTDRVCRVAGTLISQVALSVYGTFVHPDEYGGACRDYAAIYRVIDPAGGFGARLASEVELVFRHHSQAMAMAHHVSRSESCPAANLDHRAWEDPYTHRMSTASFPDLFFGALDEWRGLARAYAEGDEEAFARLMGPRNYNGEPIEG